MAFGCHSGIPLPGICLVIGSIGHHGDIVGGNDGGIARRAEVHLELGSLLCVADLPDRAHLVTATRVAEH